MTREEFSGMLETARVKSGLRLVDVCVALKTLPPHMRRIERGLHNYNMHKCLQYLSAINQRLVVRTGSLCVDLNSYEDIIKWCIDVRNSHNMSKYALAKQLDYCPNVPARIEANKATMSIDYFLKFCELFKFEVSLKQK